MAPGKQLDLFRPKTEMTPAERAFEYVTGDWKKKKEELQSIFGEGAGELRDLNVKIEAINKQVGFELAYTTGRMHQAGGLANKRYDYLLRFHNPAEIREKYHLPKAASAA